MKKELQARIFGQIGRASKEGWILPAYGGFCFSEIPDVVASILGLEVPRSPFIDEVEKLAPKAKKVVLLLIDAFGFNQLMPYVEEYEFLSRMKDRATILPLTTIFPSATPSTITTVNTGLTPQEHGLVGFKGYYEEIEQVINTLPFTSLERRPLLTQGVNPDILFKGETIYPRFSQHGIRSFVFVKSNLAQGPYNKMVQRGSEVIPCLNCSDLAVNLLQKLEDENSPSYFYVYWDGLDEMAHKYGPHSPQYLAELTSILGVFEKDFMRRIPKSLADEVVFLMTADHGQINMDPSSTVFLEKVSGLVESLQENSKGEKIFQWGNRRCVFLAIKEEMIEDMIERMQDFLGDKARVRRSEDVVREGLFGRGEYHPRFQSRVGNVMVLPVGNNTVWLNFAPTDHKKRDLGMHGGMHPDEMFIPFIVAPLKDAV